MEGSISTVSSLYAVMEFTEAQTCLVPNSFHSNGACSAVDELLHCLVDDVTKMALSFKFLDVAYLLKYRDTNEVGKK